MWWAWPEKWLGSPGAEGRRAGEAGAGGGGGDRPWWASCLGNEEFSLLRVKLRLRISS